MPDTLRKDDVTSILDEDYHDIFGIEGRTTFVLLALNSPMSKYTQIASRKRTWTPVAVTAGELKPGSEETIYRCLALRTLELPVKEMLAQGLEKHLPDDPGVLPALLSNMADEDKHD